MAIKWDEKKQCYRVIVSYGYDSTYGKKGGYRPVERHAKTQKEAKRIEKELEAARDGGIRYDAQRVTFAQFATEWAKQRAASGELKPGTAHQLEQITARWVSYLGTCKLKDITPQMVERTLWRMREEHGNGNTTLHRYYGTLAQIFRKAVDFDLILRNPCDKVKAPKVDEAERNAIPVEDFPAFIRALDAAEAEARAAYAEKEKRQIERGNGFGRTCVQNLATLSAVMAVRIGLATGARHGEVLGIRWSDFDSVRQNVHIEQALNWRTGAPGTVKTKAARRTVSLDADTVARLQEWRKFQAAQLRKVGITQSGQTPVCCNSSGGYLQPGIFDRWWRQFRTDAGFPALKFHELRHTQATYLLGARVDVQTVSTRLGHANASITLKFYAHAIPQNDAVAASVVGDMMANARADRSPIAANF